MILTNPYLIALGIPLILIICSALTKKLVRGSTWQCSDFFLGVELSLSAMASALVYGFDLAKESITISAAESVAGKTTATASFMALCFFALLSILAIHQDKEKQTQNPREKKIWLIGVTNIIG